MIVSNIKSRLRSKSVTSILLMLIMIFIPIQTAFALDAPIQSLDVNGTTIYTTGGGYNEAHGISGVTFNTETKVLTLTDANLESISSSGDLDIQLVGTNTISATTDSSALLAMGGDITITGDLSSLTIAALSSSSPAISIGAGGRLTIGEPSKSITVTVTQGFLVNCEDTYIVDGNTFTTPGGGGEPPAGEPLQLFIDGLITIDETADPQVTYFEGEGWDIEYSMYDGYQINIDATQVTTFPYITGIGDGTISINANGGNVTVSENIDNLSVNFDGRVDILFGMGPDIGDVQFVGGIFTEGSVYGGDGDVFVGTSENPAPFGIGASEVALRFGNLTINSVNQALYYYNPTPSEGEGMLISATQNAILTVASSSIATENVISALVLAGGSIDFSYTTGLGTFIPQAGYWTWVEFTGTEMENIDPIIVDCVEGTHVEDKYVLTTNEGYFLLESTANALYQLGFNYDDSDDSRVVNGTVNVIAANGYKFVSGGFYDFSIEEGTEVTIELIPNYGYQYVSGGINGNPTFPEAGRASYSFIMPANHIHISAIFEENPDIIDLETDLISEANITLPDGEINGNAELLIDEASEFDTTGFVEAAGEYEIGSYLDLSLNELIYKGSTDDAWRTTITELDSDSSITLKLGDSLQDHAQYKVIREHNGEITELDAVYDPTNDTITFDTDGFSVYGLAYYDPANPNTNGGIIGSVAMGIISLIGLCGVELVYRKKIM